MATRTLAGMAVAGLLGMLWLVAWLALGSRRSSTGRVLMAAALGAGPVLGVAVVGVLALTVPLEAVASLTSMATAVADHLRSTVVSPAMEELAKLGGVVVVARLVGGRLRPAECLVVAGAVGLGFAVVENLLYASGAGMEASTYLGDPMDLALLRGVLSTPAHVVLAMVGSLGLVGRWWDGGVPAVGAAWSWAAAAGLHGAFNAALGADHGLVVGGAIVACATALVAWAWRHSARLQARIEDEGPQVAWPAPRPDQLLGGGALDPTVSVSVSVSGG